MTHCLDAATEKEQSVLVSHTRNLQSSPPVFHGIHAQMSVQCTDRHTHTHTNTHIHTPHVPEKTVLVSQQLYAVIQAGNSCACHLRSDTSSPEGSSSSSETSPAWSLTTSLLASHSKHKKRQHVLVDTNNVKSTCVLKNKPTFDISTVLHPSAFYRLCPFQTQNENNNSNNKTRKKGKYRLDCGSPEGLRSLHSNESAS